MIFWELFKKWDRNKKNDEWEFRNSKSKKFQNRPYIICDIIKCVQDDSGHLKFDGSVRKGV